MLPTRHFIDLTQPEIAQQLKHNPLVILPAGSVEQHGPHLPTGTDTFAANVIAHRVADRLARINVGAGRQVRAVLLDAAGGQDDQRIVLELLRDLGLGEIDEMAGRQHNVVPED